MKTPANLLTVLSETMWSSPHEWQTLITGIFAILAAILAVLTPFMAYWLGRRRDKKREIEQRRTLQRSLSGEISVIRRGLDGISKSAEGPVRLGRSPSKEQLSLYAMPSTPIFDVSRNNVGLLNYDILLGVILFYSKLVTIQQRIDFIRWQAQEVLPLQFEEIKKEVDEAIELADNVTTRM